jgi:hypothetical protein
VSTNPVHLVREGEMMPSALIPFCALSSDLETLGQSYPSLSYPVCNQFRPAILDGQLCYQLNLESVLGNRHQLESGKRGSLMLLIDYNLERSVNHNNFKQEESKRERKLLSFEVLPRNSQTSAKIHIHTISPFDAYGEGNFRMTALKKMTGTDKFLKLTKEEKKCQNEMFEECKVLSFINSIEQNCGCVPWSLVQVWPRKVGYI